MICQYNSDDHQLQVQEKLKLSRLEKHTDKKKHNIVTDCLTELIQVIEQLSAQGHADFSTDSHEIK